MRLTDRDTVDYFDRRVTEYSLARFDHAVAFLNAEASAASSFLDIGCGTGNILERILNETPIRTVAGIDPAPNCVEKTKQRLACSAYVGSILDSEFVQGLGLQFDFALIASVVHHLIGETRQASVERAQLAIEHSLRLVRPGGYLIVFEPGVYPPRAAVALFHTKRFVTRFTSRRVQLFDKWNNIGAPVISYYTDEELAGMLERNRGCRIVDRHVEDIHVNILWRLGGIRRRINTTLVAQRIE